MKTKEESSFKLSKGELVVVCDLLYRRMEFLDHHIPAMKRIAKQTREDPKIAASARRELRGELKRVQKLFCKVTRELQSR